MKALGFLARFTGRSDILQHTPNILVTMSNLICHQQDGGQG
jgi:hypothetical protein